MVRKNLPNLTGKKFTKLKVVKLTGKSSGGARLWLCKCDCGNDAKVKTSSLLNGNTKSCGCLWKRHGMSDTRVHKSWSGMINRCSNKRSDDWPEYGGRGIKVCKRWMRFENFFADMGIPPVGMSLDRKNNHGDYKPSNCRWATPKQQARNTRNNRVINFKGKKKSMAEWAEIYGIKLSVLHARLKSGWDLNLALTIPIGHPKEFPASMTADEIKAIRKARKVAYKKNWWRINGRRGQASERKSTDTEAPK